MVSAALGTKRNCPSCSNRFYDLNKTPIVCPKCGTSFIAEAILPSKGEQPAAAPRPVPREVVRDDDAVPEDVELVSLEEAEEPDDEADGIEDVEIEDDAGAQDTFLEEEEEEEGPVGGMIGSKDNE